jgi:hypothetical protein
MRVTAAGAAPGRTEARIPGGNDGFWIGLDWRRSFGVSKKLDILSHHITLLADEIDENDEIDSDGSYVVFVVFVSQRSGV